MSSKANNISPIVADLEEQLENDRWFNERLLQTRTIILSGSVNDRLADQVVTSLLLLTTDNPEKPIDLMINSGGGSVTSGFAIFDMIRFVRPQVRCICAGLTASIATIILCATDKENRISLPNARFLIHQPLIPMQVFGAASDLEITANEIVKTRRTINEVLAEACGKPFETVERDTQRDYWMDAAAAVDYGLIGRVVNKRTEL
jgi:ATP-dependent Clp protease protease subunit